MRIVNNKLICKKCCYRKGILYKMIHSEHWYIAGHNDELLATDLFLPEKPENIFKDNLIFLTLENLTYDNYYKFILKNDYEHYEKLEKILLKKKTR